MFNIRSMTRTKSVQESWRSSCVIIRKVYLFMKNIKILITCSSYSIHLKLYLYASCQILTKTEGHGDIEPCNMQQSDTESYQNLFTIVDIFWSMDKQTHSQAIYSQNSHGKKRMQKTKKRKGKTNMNWLNVCGIYAFIAVVTIMLHF